jgi:hypothetical protein
MVSAIRRRIIFPSFIRGGDNDMNLPEWSYFISAVYLS